MNRQMLDTLAAIAAAPNAEDELRPLEVVPDLQDGEEDVFACGAVGHGLASWFFRLVLRTSRVSFDVTLPCWRVLDGETGRDQNARSIQTVCRLVLVALGTDGFPPEDARLEVVADVGNRCDWRLVSPSGEDVKSGDGWNTLVDLFGRAIESSPDKNGLFVINP